MTDIKAIEARAAAATQACPVCNGEGRVYRMTPTYEAMAADAGCGSFGWTGPTHEWRSCHPCDGSGIIVHSRTDIPALLDTISALRAEAEIERKVTLATIKDLQDQRHLCDLLHEALSDADASLGGCSPTSGGSDGRWCATHLDYRWVDDAKRCELTEAIGAAITAYEEAQK